MGAVPLRAYVDLTREAGDPTLEPESIRRGGATGGGHAVPQRLDIGLELPQHDTFG